MICHRLTVNSVTYCFLMKLLQFNICKKDSYRKGTPQDKDFLCVPNQMLPRKTLPNANSYEERGNL